jgi:hypothetical protein
MQTKEIEKERKVKKKYKQRSLSWVSRLLQPSTSLRRLPWLSSSVVVSDRHGGGSQCRYRGHGALSQTKTVTSSVEESFKSGLGGGEAHQIRPVERC